MTDYQFVDATDDFSTHTKVKIGVPQGFVLGPMRSTLCMYDKVGSLIFSDNVTHDGCSRKNSEAYRNTPQSTEKCMNYQNNKILGLEKKGVCQFTLRILTLLTNEL